MKPYISKAYLHHLIKTARKIEAEQESLSHENSPGVGCDEHVVFTLLCEECLKARLEYERVRDEWLNGKRL